MRTRSIAAIFILVLVAGLYLVTHAQSSTLRATWKTTPGGIGIEGLTKTYEGFLTNAGGLPIRISICDYLTDAMARGATVAHSIQRWDRSSRSWNAFWSIPENEFCKPYPLGIVRGDIRKMWLWPGQSISTDFIAIQAMDGLDLNDHLRYSITPFVDRPEIAIVSPAFVIDERPRSHGTPARMRH